MVLEKARGKVALQPGFSLMAWMRLSSDGTDLTGGVGAVDEDEDDASWKEWTLDEVKKHHARDDAWMALHGRVYNITPYLNYHPGGVETLLEAAGVDGTDLFDKYHSWVNAKGIMQACCVGRLTLRGGGSDAAPISFNDTAAVDGATSAADGDMAAAVVGDSAVGDPGRRPRTICWDEEGIQAHDAERGVLFGTMKVDHVETPYLYLDEANPEGDSAAINSKYLPALVPQVVPPNAPGPYTMPVAALEHALGLLKTDEDGLVNLSRPKWAHADEFGVQRQELYTREASIAVLSRDLPGTPPHLLLRDTCPAHLLRDHLLALSAAPWLHAHARRRLASLHVTV